MARPPSRADETRKVESWSTHRDFVHPECEQRAAHLRARLFWPPRVAPCAVKKILRGKGWDSESRPTRISGVGGPPTNWLSLKAAGNSSSAHLETHFRFLRLAVVDRGSLDTRPRRKRRPVISHRLRPPSCPSCPANEQGPGFRTCRLGAS